MANSKAPRRHLMSLDVESEVLLWGLTQLERIEDLAARRRVTDYWSAKAPTLPFTDGKGKVLDEHPKDSEPPPMIKFIHEQKAKDGDAAEAAEA